MNNMKVLNRIATLNETWLTHEADQRHTEICSREAGIEDSKVVDTPIDKPDKDARSRNAVLNAELDDELITPPGATVYKGIVARINHLGQDRSEIRYMVEL